MRTSYKILIGYVFLLFLSYLAMGWFQPDPPTSDSAILSAIAAVGSAISHMIDWIVSTWVIGTVVCGFAWYVSHRSGWDKYTIGFLWCTLLNIALFMVYIFAS